jgi:type I restriction enzyme, S subunit
VEVKPGCKQTEIGFLPEDWCLTSVSDLCEIVVDCKNRTPPVIEGGDYAVVRTPNVRAGKFVREELRFTDVESYRQWTARAAPQVGDVLITREAPLGEVCLVPSDLKVCLGQRMMMYRPDSEKTTSRFLLYALTSESVQANLLKKIGGSTVGHAKVDDIRFLQIPLPPTKSEQETIAEALGDADALVENLEHLVEKKRKVKLGAMQELLTGRKRLQGFTKEWNIRPLREVCRLIVDGTHFTPRYVESGVPFYSVENVTANDFIDTKFISQAEHTQLCKRCRPEKGDILLTRIGSIGDTKLIDWDVKASIYVSLALLKVDQSLDPRYLYCYSKSQQFRRDMEDRSLMNASPKKINMGAIGDVPVPVPSVLEQAAIATILTDMDDELVALDSKLSSFRQVRQGMMQELLTGRIRLV